MPWQLSEADRARLEEARARLVQGGEFQDSTDLQVGERATVAERSSLRGARERSKAEQPQAPPDREGLEPFSDCRCCRRPRRATVLGCLSNLDFSHLSTGLTAVCLDDGEDRGAASPPAQ